MQRNVKNLVGHNIQATDGELGKVHEFYFDDATWTIRYLVVETGNWLSNRKVLLAPASLGKPDWESQRLLVNLTMEQVRNSPVSDTDKPVSRQHEIELAQHYAWPTYWSGGMSVGSMPGMTPSVPVLDKSVPGHNVSAPEWQDDLHLRSTRHVTGYHIQATDGEIGHVEDFIIDDAIWAILYLVVDTRNWLPGKNVLLVPRWLKEVNWDTSKVFVDLTRESVKNCPAYDPSQPINKEYEGKISDYYGRPK